MTGKADRRNYSGKHRSHGLHFLALTDERGRLIWISAARPGRSHDNTAARHDRILRRSCLLRAISLTFPAMTPSSTIALGSRAAGAAPGRPHADWLPSRPDRRRPPGHSRQEPVSRPLCQMTYSADCRPRPA
ncbi:transposase family protein [Streptomyces syringium]|uniref:transposase family protein n=1 Tax=Streptomyces syringium TaxID=76729 RepID=UPI003447B593